MLGSFANVYVASRDCFSNLSKHFLDDRGCNLKFAFPKRHKARHYGHTRQHQQASEPGSPRNWSAQGLIVLEQRQDLLDDRPDVHLMEIEVVENPMVLQTGDPAKARTVFQEFGRRESSVQVDIVVDDRDASAGRAVSGRGTLDGRVNSPQISRARDERVLRKYLDADRTAAAGSASATWTPFLNRPSSHLTSSPSRHNSDCNPRAPQPVLDRRLSLKPVPRTEHQSAAARMRSDPERDARWPTANRDGLHVHDHSNSCKRCNIEA